MGGVFSTHEENTKGIDRLGDLSENRVVKWTWKSICDVVDWTYLAQDGAKQRAVVNTVINLCVPQSRALECDVLYTAVYGRLSHPRATFCV
jgi:hypothetical protein